MSVNKYIDVIYVCIHIYTYICILLNISIHTLEYYSAIKKNEILSFVTTWINLGIISFNEVHQIKTITIWSLLYRT